MGVMSDPFGPYEDLNICFRRQINSGYLLETGHSVVEEEDQRVMVSYSGGTPEHGQYPRPLTDLGLGTSLTSPPPRGNWRDGFQIPDSALGAT